MEIKASSKYLRISPRKLRLLTKELHGLSAQKALEKLAFYPQRGNDLLIKVVKQAIANAATNFKQSKEGLIIKKIEVGDGPSFKRIDKSHGARFNRGTIKRKTAHLYLILESKETGIKTEKQIKKSVNKEPKTAKEVRPPSPRLRRANGTKS